MEYKKDKFREKLVEVHGRQWNRAWKRLSRKASALKQSLKKRSEEYDVLFDISLDDIKKLFLSKLKFILAYLKFVELIPEVR